MAGTTRVPTGAGRTGAPRHHPSIRPSSARAGSLAPPAQGLRSRAGAISPADTNASILSRPRSPETTGMKRKQRDFETDGGGETNINVVVRCRGRSEREVRENSGVVVSTEGARGKTVELSMGPNALSNKTYHFDKVFSPAADQAMLYEDVVAPILEDMLRGYNCTVFAYGQTGTGKTYTMSGDMTETLGLLSDAAGIIPRVLSSLFRKLEADGSDNSIKCSFIELYNEELRDLLSREDNSKLKMFEDSQKKGHTATVVQGVEETHIKSAAQGIKLLREGSHKRQVAATKCNDLSSRSHTVFTITVYVKTPSDGGEDFIAAGKLNLVDLAGSENIQRSGAENKRAAEAGLINKSLLTLGRVINALVDHSSHIPYRESKLTRLLQDSLGGRTKTCIIATLSPAKSNLEETISTLDYAFRAKNIRNKPQTNPLISKKTLLREFTVEIEKLKSDLIACRQRNGVYLTNEAYEEMTIESESRRILSEEQKAKIETMEANLRNKLQELFALTSDFAVLKKDNEGTRTALNATNEVLKQTEIVLANTQQNLADEALLRKAHEATEKELLAKGDELMDTLGRTVKDVNGLHAKLKRKSDVQSVNRTQWQQSQTQIDDITKLVESRVREFENNHRELIDDLSHRIQTFIAGQVDAAAERTESLDQSLAVYEEAHMAALDASAKGKDDMNTTLEEITVLREEVKDQVGRGLQGLSAAAGRIAKEVIEEMEGLHSQLHSSYSALGKDFKIIFEDLVKHLNSQKQEAETLRTQMVQAAAEAIESEKKINQRIEQCLDDERQAAAAGRQSLLLQITDLINANGAVQDKRITSKFDQVRQEAADSRKHFETALASYAEGMENWSVKEGQVEGDVVKSRDALKARLKTDWTTASEHSARIQATTKSIHSETVRIVDQQIEELAVQMQALDVFATKARSQNDSCHENRVAAIEKAASSAHSTHTQSKSSLESDRQRIEGLGSDIAAPQQSLSSDLSSLKENVCIPLTELRESTLAAPIQEYRITGETPQKMEYSYPLSLPCTEPHAQLLGRSTDRVETLSELPDLLEGPLSPSKAHVFADEPETTAEDTTVPRPATADGSLREITGNVNGAVNFTVSEAKGEVEVLSKSASAMGPPPLKRHATENSKVGSRGNRGKENVGVKGDREAFGGRRLRSSTPHQHQHG